MIRLAHIIKEHEEDFLEKYGKFLLPGHLKALAAIKICRSEGSPKMLVQCENAGCSHKMLLIHSCGHRHCPHCQNHETQAWIDKQMRKQVPAGYFMITFTLPAQFRNMAWKNQRLVYSLLFDSAWDTIKEFAANDRRLGGMPGAIAVLHTHSRELNIHPHVHIVMPAASIDRKYGLWAEKQGKYLFNEKALAKVFRAKMLDALNKNGLPLPKQYPPEWVAHCKQVGKGRKALLYLGQYLYRGVIKEKDILSCRNGMVTYRFAENKNHNAPNRNIYAEQSRSTDAYTYKTLPAVDFIWLVMQHVLPRGFRRARNYGFLHSNSKKMIRIIQWIFRMYLPGSLKKRPRKRKICPRCGAFMNIVMCGLPPDFRLPELKPL